jgi:hypothetical protein
VPPNIGGKMPYIFIVIVGTLIAKGFLGKKKGRKT